jgi:hypothetical protein
VDKAYDPEFCFRTQGGRKVRVALNIPAYQFSALGENNGWIPVPSGVLWKSESIQNIEIFST